MKCHICLVNLTDCKRLEQIFLGPAVFGSVLYKLFKSSSDSALKGTESKGLGNEEGTNSSVNKDKNDADFDTSLYLLYMEQI